MHIPSYQIHNVLKTYSKQLSKGRILDKQKAIANIGKQGSDRINIYAEGKRQAIIDKVAADIVDRITRFGPQDEVDHEIVSQLQDELGEDIEFKAQKNTEFVYNRIDDNEEKTTNTLSVENSDFLIKRLEQLAREAVNKNMET